MSITEAPTTPGTTNEERARALLAAVFRWHANHRPPTVAPPQVVVPPQLSWVADQAPVFTITEAGRRALERDPSTDIPREPRRRTSEENAA